MKCILYCVFRCAERGMETEGTINGIAGRGVSVLAAHELCAALSWIEPNEEVPDLERVVEYETVVEAFHRERTVVPMRYGAVFQDEEAAGRLLAESRDRFEALLRHFDGCVEMGVRALIGADETAAEEPEAMRGGQSGAKTSTGLAYLLERKAYYEAQKRIDAQAVSLADRLKEALAGLYRELKVELPSGGTDGPLRVQSSTSPPILSLFFLVPRSSITAFQQAFLRFEDKESIPVMLSGPWPPFNFSSGGQDGAS